MKKAISAVIITKNEEENITACLESIAEVVDEIIVVDHNSSDRTAEIARNNGATVITAEWNTYGISKNLGNQHAKNDWILSIDADERLSPELQTSIAKCGLDESHIYALDRCTYYNHKAIKFGSWYPDWKKRIFNKRHTQWSENKVHEYLIIPNNASVVRLKGYLNHFSFKNKSDLDRRMTLYAKLKAMEMVEKDQQLSPFKVYFGPFLRFIKSYILKLGFLHGKLGWIIANEEAKMVRKRYQFYEHLKMKSDKT